MAATHPDSLGELAEHRVGDARGSRVRGGGMPSVVPVAISLVQHVGARAAIAIEPSGGTR
jgi:hypothetical protein